MTNDIKLYKLPSGLELIGKVVEEGFGWVILEHVLQFAVEKTGADQYALRLAPYSPTLPEAKWKYYTNQFLCEAVEVPPGMKKAYISQTTNIQIISSLDQMESMK